VPPPKLDFIGKAAPFRKTGKPSQLLIQSQRISSYVTIGLNFTARLQLHSTSVSGAAAGPGPAGLGTPSGPPPQATGGRAAPGPGREGGP
jgi:hypothetical protein